MRASAYCSCMASGSVGRLDRTSCHHSTWTLWETSLSPSPFSRPPHHFRRHLSISLAFWNPRRGRPVRFCMPILGVSPPPIRHAPSLICSIYVI